MKRLTREESRALTTERLLEAGAAVFARLGLNGASIEDIVEAAGFSRGAFYSNFGSKEELFLTLVERHVKQKRDELLAFVRSNQLACRAELRAFYTQQGMERTWSLLMAECRLCATRDPELRKRLLRIEKEHRELVTELVRELLGPEPKGCADAADVLALSLITLAEGLSVRHLLDPKGIPASVVERVLGDAFDALLARACEPR